jgi:chemotaxis protein histidine kinase CheA
MFQALTRDRQGFQSFLDEANRIVEELLSSAGDLATQRHLLHTLKGIASMVSLNLIAQLCHRAEDDLEEHRSTPVDAIEALRGRWLALNVEFQLLLGGQGLDTISVQAKDVDLLCADIARGLPPAEIAERLAAWRDEPVERHLARLGDYARALASRLGKGEASIVLEGHGLKLDRDRWAPLWSDLVHVVRNAVDHGWESPAERRAAGKPAQPKLRLGAYMRANDLTIELEDDGRGIDWDAIRHAASQRDLPVRTESDLTAALFIAGVSGRDEVCALSGRGMGMSALQARVEEFAGRIEVTSRRGEGTCWRISFPSSSLMRQRVPGSILPGRELDDEGERDCVK